MSTKSRTRSKTRLSRALGIALTPKAAKYLEKRPYAPGEHGRTKRKQTATTPFVCARSSVCAPSTASARSSAARSPSKRLVAPRA